MARIAGNAARDGLRDALLEEARHLANVIGPAAPEAAAEVARLVRQLATGKPVRLHRWELPEGTPERRAGDLADDVTVDRLGRVADV